MTRATRFRYRILMLLVLVSFVSYVLRYLMSAAAPSLVQEYGLSERQLGWVLGAFALSYGLLQFPAGVWADRLGARRAMPLAMLGWGLLTLVMFWMPAGNSVSTQTALLLLIAVRLGVGVVHAPLYPLTGAVTQSWFPPDRWALPNGLSSAGLTVGSAVTAPLFVGLIAVAGWRFSFGVLSMLAFMAAVVWWLTVRDEPSQHRQVNEAERELILSGRHRPQPAPTLSWRAVAGNRALWLLAASYFCMNYLFYQLFNWMFYYLVEVRDVADSTAGWLNSLQWVMAALGATLGALWCDRLSRRRGLQVSCRRVAVSGLLISGLLMSAGAVVHTPWLLAVVLAVCFFFHQSTEGAYWAAAIRLGGAQAAAACGLMNMGGNLVGALNALLVPWLAARYGWAVALGSGTGFALAGAAMWWFIRLEETDSGDIGSRQQAAVNP